MSMKEHWENEDYNELVRLRAIERTSISLIEYVKRRHPGEDLHCPYMMALELALKKN